MPSSGAAPGLRGDYRALSVTLTVGAVYDVIFALLFVVAPGYVASSFHLPLPGESFYLRLLAVLLVLAGSVYLVSARDPVRFRPLVMVAIGGRTLGFLALALSALGRTDLNGLWLPAFGDLAFALAHGTAGRRLLWR